LVRGDAESDWTSGLKGRGRNRPEIVDIESMPRLVTAVAFDQFVFDDKGVTKTGGSSLVRGTGSAGTAIAVGSVPWPGMPIEWIALQSRRATDLLGLAGDEMDAVGHNRFDDRFAVDADDVSRFRMLFRTSLRDWLVDFDDTHGPLIVIFDGAAEPAESAPRRRATDAKDARNADDASLVPTVFLAREVVDDNAVVATLGLTEELTEHIRASVGH
jgi:hypothetical protein